jgi:hypothetical protein
MNYPTPRSLLEDIVVAKRKPAKSKIPPEPKPKLNPYRLPYRQTAVHRPQKGKAKKSK